MDGREFLAELPGASYPLVIFDPQYRGVLDKLSYGNEGERREDQVKNREFVVERLHEILAA